MTIRFVSNLAIGAMLYSAAAFGAPDPFADVEIDSTPVAAVPADIRVIPGHGELCDIATVRHNLATIGATRQFVVDALDGGASLEEVIESGLGEEYAEWGSGFISEERWIRIIDADRRMRQSAQR